MASTYTVNGIELIANGEQTNSWGTTTNENWELMEEMVAGGVSIALTGTTYTLTTTDGVSSDGRHAVIIFTGTPGGTCTVTISPNDVQKTYYIVNNSDETVTMSQGSGTTVDIDASNSKVVFCDGGGATAAVTDLSTTLADLGVTASAAELNYVDGVTSAIQDQLDAAFAVGQTWTDVTSSRVNDTTYTNSTGKAIMVAIITIESSSPSLFYVDGDLIQRFDVVSETPYYTLGTVVPDGSTYKFDGGGDAFTSWWELR